MSILKCICADGLFSSLRYLHTQASDLMPALWKFVLRQYLSFSRFWSFRNI
jgi:hypothetical protein